MRTTRIEPPPRPATLYRGSLKFLTSRTRELAWIGHIPAWLLMLEEEVDRVLHNNRNAPLVQRLEKAVPVIPITRQQLQDQFNEAMSQNRGIKGPESS